MAAVRTLFVTYRQTIHQQLVREAAPPGLELTMLTSPTKDDVLAALDDKEILVSERAGAVDADHLAAGPNLRLIQRLGSQVHDIDLDFAEAAGVAVCYWPLGGCTMVAEHALMQILGLARRFREGSEVVIEAAPWGTGPRPTDANTFNSNWSGREDVRHIHGTTIGVIGFGEIGTELAIRLRSFGCRVLYNRRHRLPATAEERLRVEYASVEQLAAESDTVVSLLPHSDGTEGSIDAGFIGRMKPGAMLVSTGASTILDEDAVAEAYRSGRLGGVATDGYRWEPVRPDNPLVILARDRSANVVLTPHSAQGDRKLDADARRVEWTNVVNLMEGRPLEHRLV